MSKKRIPKHRRKYPRAFIEYWDNVEIDGIAVHDDFKEEAYLAWKAGTQNGPIRRSRRLSLSHEVW